MSATMPAPASDAPELPDGQEWLLGPDSVTWKVFLTPWVPVIGGFRALIVEALHPHAMRGVYEHSSYLQRPADRLERTAYYVNATAFGTVDEAERAALRVRAMHRKVKGHDPVTGRPYSADDPDSQVWVHFVQWYSYLVAHRVFAGNLSPEEEDRFCAEGVRIATLLGTPAELVPASVEEARAYFDRIGDELCVTAGTRDAIDLVTGRSVPGPRELAGLDRSVAMQRLLALPVGRTIGSAAVATIPRDLRRLAGIDRSAAEDAAAIAATRALLLGLRTPGLTGFLYPRIFGRRGREIGQRARRVYAEAA